MMIVKSKALQDLHTSPTKNDSFVYKTKVFYKIKMQYMQYMHDFNSLITVYPSKTVQLNASVLLIVFYAFDFE